MFLNFFFNNEMNLVAKIMQSAYLCVILLSSTKITISHGFNLISKS